MLGVRSDKTIKAQKTCSHPILECAIISSVCQADRLALQPAEITITGEIRRPRTHSLNHNNQQMFHCFSCFFLEIYDDFKLFPLLPPRLLTGRYFIPTWKKFALKVLRRIYSVFWVWYKWNHSRDKIKIFVELFKFSTFLICHVFYLRTSLKKIC